MATSHDDLDVSSDSGMGAPAASPARTPRVERPGQPEGGARYDWIAALLSALVVGGVYLDGWAHNHGKVDQTFFTPWHAVLYAGYAIYGLFLLVSGIRWYRAGYAWNRALPCGYPLSFVGAVVFAVGGVLDLIWHTLFGFEVSVQALLSPTHLLLATGLFMMITGPLRSIWNRTRGTRALSWSAGAPAVLVLAFVLSLLAFFTQFAHPLVRAWAATNPALRTVHGDLYVMRADGTGQTRLTTVLQDASTPSWSPDGTQLAFDAGNGNTSGIYVMRANGTGLERLTPSDANDFQPAWSPKGGRIAFIAQNGNTSHLMVMNADGSGARQLATGGGNVYGPAWSPDGGTIIFESNAGGSFNLYTINASGGQPKRLTRTGGADDFMAAWSPNGRRIAFTSNRDGSDQIYVMNADGSGQQRLTSPSGALATTTAESFSPAWSPDGARIAFVTTRGGNAEIYTMRADGSRPVNLSNNASLDNGNGSIAWSRDGSLIAYGAVGHAGIDADMSTALGIASILLQTAFLMGALLLALRRWALPLGTATLLFTLSAVLISFMNDQYRLIPVAIVAGIVADALLFALRPGLDRVRQLRIFAFAVPAIYFLLYFLALALTGGVGWVIHLWLGACVMAGILGLFVSYLVVLPRLDGGQTAY